MGHYRAYRAGNGKFRAYRAGIGNFLNLRLFSTFWSCHGCYGATFEYPAMLHEPRDDPPLFLPWRPGAYMDSARSKFQTGLVLSHESWTARSLNGHYLSWLMLEWCDRDAPSRRIHHPSPLRVLGLQIGIPALFCTFRGAFL